ncbi:MAG: beta-propeller domain-containing protein [Pseudomonadales bacterium]|nr:beta-propeller domain-containing protein [Pseudomonadales bacterium]
MKAKKLNSIEIRIVALASLIALTTGLASCGGNSDKEEDSSAQMLIPAESSADFTELVKSSYRNIGAIASTRTNTVVTLEEDLNFAVDEASTGAAPPATSDSRDSDSQSGGSSSSTNLIEAGVDEADLMKFDGEFVFTVEESTGYQGWNCHTCVIIDDGGLIADSGVSSDSSDSSFFYAPTPIEPARIHVHRANEDPASADWISSVELSEKGASTMGLYLNGSREDNTAQLISVNSSNNYGWERWAQTESWQGGKTSIHFLDTNNPAELTETQKLELQGFYIDSRVVDGVLYIVSRHTPTLDGFQYYPRTEEQENTNLSIIENLDIDGILPALIINDGEEQKLVSAENCFVPQADETGYWPSIITITAVTLSTPTEPSSSCALASGAGLYASPNALFLTQDQNDNGDRKTRIHKFALSSSGATYRGSGEVDGYLGWNGSTAFKMSEKDGYFRIITTTGSWGNLEHHLTILAENTTTESDATQSENESTPLALTTIARIPNDERPQAIGKPGENIYGVRFLGDRGYVVTFLQIDPLYILDLSDPSDPFVAGELEVPGVSEYLQLLDEDSLLGIGRSDNNKVQVSLFDVSDASNPTLANTSIVGNYSSAAYDYHSIAWTHDSESAQTKFAFPVTRYRGDDWGSSETGLAFLEIDTLNNTFLTEDNMPVFKNNFGPWRYGVNSAARSLIQGDAIHYISGHLIWSASQMDLEQVQGPQGQWALSISLTPYLDSIAAQTVDNANLTIEGDTLTMNFEGSSCIDEWNLYIGTIFKESNPVQVDSKLYGVPNGEVCIQVMTPVSLRFNLTQLKNTYFQAYQAESGSILLNIEHAGSVNYLF